MLNLLWGRSSKRILADAHICFVGNSITEWSDATASGRWPERLKLLPLYNSDRCQFSIVAQPGISTTRLLAEAPGTVDPLLQRGRLNICLIWEAINDVGATGGSATSVGNNLQTFCLARRAAGWKTIVFGLQAARVAGGGVTSQAGFDAVRGQLNLWLAANWRSFADAYVDPSSASKLNLALPADAPDGVHYTSVALNDLLPLVDSALMSIPLSP